MKFQVAMTILEQLGGMPNLKMMTGAKGFLADHRGVQFKVGSNAKGVTAMRIELNAEDTYDIRVVYRGGKVIPHFGIYAEDLKPFFERETGMYLTLGRIVMVRR
jgi:hypothetical protein